MLDFASSGAPRPREPIFAIPAVVVALVALLLAIQAVSSFVSDATLDGLFIDWGFIPGRLTVSLWPEKLGELLARSNVSQDALTQARMWRETTFAHPGARPWTLLTYALLHVSWTHAAMNCLWIVAFGPPVARRFGAVRFLTFLATSAVAGALAHWAAFSMEFAPLIGASAADSGLMAAVARFMFQPGAPLAASGYHLASRADPLANAPAASLREVFTDRRTLGFIGIWMATNFVFGAGAQTLGASEGPVAWIAHAGGFAVGLLLFPLFDRRRG